jgi:hypothetical protein
MDERMVMDKNRRKTDADPLAMLMGPDTGAGMWSAEDFPGLLEHLLDTKVADELAGWVPDDPESNSTFRELFESERPSRTLLALIKDRAKDSLGEGGGWLPPEVANALYVAVLSKASTCGWEDFSNLDSERFTSRLRWGLAQGWIPETLRVRMRSALGSAGIRAEGSPS